MAKLITLSEDDLEILKEVISRERRRPPAHPTIPRVDFWEEQTGPETYVALTPAAGIPALTEGPDVGTAHGGGDVPGSAVG